jgi:DNA primase
MPGIDFREVRARLRLAEVLELLGFVARTRVGDQVHGPCPVHGSQSPTSRSFAAHLGKQVWHCFRCGAGGNALDLWVAVTRQGLHAAALDLCQRLGRDVPWARGGWAPSARSLVTRNRKHPMENKTMHDP